MTAPISIMKAPKVIIITLIAIKIAPIASIIALIAIWIASMAVFVAPYNYFGVILIPILGYSSSYWGYYNNPLLSLSSLPHLFPAEEDGGGGPHKPLFSFPPLI